MSGALPRRRSWLWLQGLACGAVLAAATAPTLLLAVLLAPGLVCYAVERTDGKPLTQSMLLLGLASAFTPLRMLWEDGHTMGACLAILADPARTGLSWLAGAGGWLMTAVAHMVARSCSDLKTRRQVALLERERGQLEVEWGKLDAPTSPRT